MKITAAASYGITAIVQIAAANGQVISNSAICRAHKMPERFVLQVLRYLVSADLLISVRGVFGGYKLAKPANKITLLEIIEAIDGPLSRDKTLDLTGLAHSSQATIEKTLAAVTADARKQLAAVTLADLRAAKAA